MLVFSDWTVVKLKPSPDENPYERSWKRGFGNLIVSANEIRGNIICCLLNIGAVRGREKDSMSRPTDSRWAQSISTYNFIEYCLHRRSKAVEKFYDQFGMRAFLDEMMIWTLLRKYVELRMNAYFGSQATAALICILIMLLMLTMMRVFFCGTLPLNFGTMMRMIKEARASKLTLPSISCSTPRASEENREANIRLHDISCSSHEAFLITAS
ncbi:hypothetical protein POM88_040385 [Heracleum sosnowskyi]|uniref:Uncharacterized protein n=1 Tax=Heracleum sosnowskyi TaxID=360622 RepID=A0AAD8HCW1_9APIA|nr:hypothetical protein POM88_040385 [Heracleum sosnowskyi]